MRQPTLASVVGCLLALSATAMAGAFDGSWKIEWKCEGATGALADRCAEGSDVFTLDLVTTEDRICGMHLATAQLGNRVDEGDLIDGEPSISGTIEGGVATVRFRSAWGGTGVAKISLRDKQLSWKVVESKGQSWIPDEALLDLIQPSARDVESMPERCDQEKVTPDSSLQARER